MSAGSGPRTNRRFKVVEWPMKDLVEDPRSRREVLLGSLAVGGLLLMGCARSQRQALGPPSPVWPLQRRGLDENLSDRPGSLSATPMPLDASTPRVMPRSAWARTGPTLSLANPMGRIERITIHHDAMDASGFRNQADASQRLSNIQRAHLGNGWADIGYHYAIDPMGNVWAGRPVQLQGAHVKDWNENNLGIMLMGNFMHERPTPQALAALARLVSSESARYRVPSSMIRTHRELSPTACPGDHLQREIHAARSRRLAGFV